MSYSRKRSLSPNSVDRSYNQQSSLSRIWTYLVRRKQQDKQVKFKLNYGNPEILTTDHSASPEEYNRQILTTDHSASPEEYNRQILSDKRRKISIQQTNELKGFIPRVSVDYGKSTSNYEDYLNKIQKENDEITSNIEGRATLALEDPVDPQGKYDSPIPEISEVRRQSRQIISAFQPDSDLSDPESKEEEDTPPVLYEIASLYQDEDGNLVRPPFINLAPQERYQLLQMKRSIEATRALQMKLKYTVNPNETRSLLLDNNKVETSTQTQNINYLRKKLHFNDLITRLESGPAKKKRNTGTVFSGEFFYEVEEIKPKEDDKLTGYLGSLSKPKFKESHSNERKEFTTTSNVVLDSDYVSKTANINDIIKIKDDKESHKQTIEPSLGFKFSINKDDITNIINKGNEEADTKAASEKDKTVKFDFNQQPVPEDKTQKPTFSFGKPVENKSASSISFGANSAGSESTNKPKFSFGGSSTEAGKLDEKPVQQEEPRRKRRIPAGEASSDVPKFSFGGLPSSSQPSTLDDKESNSGPKFSFGSKKPDGGLFGKPSEAIKEPTQVKLPESTGATLSFKPGPIAFGSKTSESTPSLSDKSETPKFSFGEKKEAPPDATEKNSAPKFSFGSTEKKESTPKFSFGSNEKKEDTPKFSFGSNEKKEDTPKLSFGSTEKKEETPKFSFGSTEKKEETPKFSFGSTAKETTPAFSFGTEKKEDTPKPTLEKKDPPTFSFGSSTATPSAAPEKKDTPAFSFGAPSTAAPDTKKSSTPFSFGDKKEVTPSFGNTSSAPASQFNFGAVEKPVFSGPSSRASSAEPKSNFNFNSAPKTFNFGNALLPSLSSAPNLASNGGFLFGATNANPTANAGAGTGFQATTPFGKSATPTSFSAGPQANSINGIANGITPIKPTNTFGSVNRETTPNQFNFNRSNTNTPEFGSFGAQPGAPINGMNGMNGINPSGMTPTNSGGMPGVNPANRPNRKFAKMRKRRI